MHSQVLGYNIVYARVECHIFHNHTTNLHTILCSQYNLLLELFGNIITSSTQHHTDVTTISTIRIYFEAHGVGTLVLAVTAQLFAKIHFTIQDFHDGGVFSLGQRQREADILGLSPFVAEGGIECNGLTCIDLTIAIATLSIVQHISHHAE